MQHLLLRARKDPFEVVSPEATLESNMIGGNSGNLIFLEAAYKLLSTTRTSVAVDRFVIDPSAADRINERYDAYVIPLANAFRKSYETNLIRLSQLIERLRIPVVVLGVGAQSNVRYETDRLERIEPAVRRFVTAVLDRGPSIGVRGEFTASYLQGLGYRDVEVIGCPSMFLHGDRLPVAKRSPALGRDARIALNVSPYVKPMGPIALAHALRYPNLVYIPQDIDSLERLLWGNPPAPVPGDRATHLATALAGEIDPMPVHLDHPLLRDDRTRFFVDPWPWLELLRGMDFAFGTRIHGNISALLAGTPAYVFAHDSRTLEMARYFEIPHQVMADVPADVDAADLYGRADYGPLVAKHAGRFATFSEYLARHGLRHVFEAGEDPSRFDARVAVTRYPAAVTVHSGAIATGPTQQWRRLRRRLRRAVRTSRVRSLRDAIVRRWSGTGRPVPAADE